MNKIKDANKPHARQDEIIVEELTDEILIYDLQGDTAYCLGHIAALIWKQCNGTHSVPQIMQAVGAELKTPVEENVVINVLGQLSGARLLQVPFPSHAPLLSRRALIKCAGAVAATAFITSIVAPTAAEAATQFPRGARCAASAECQSGLCNMSGTCE
jgi:hypothetical protein